MEKQSASLFAQIFIEYLKDLAILVRETFTGGFEYLKYKKLSGADIVEYSTPGEKIDAKKNVT